MSIFLNKDNKVSPKNNKENNSHTNSSRSNDPRQDHRSRVHQEARQNDMREG